MKKHTDQNKKTEKKAITQRRSNHVSFSIKDTDQRPRAIAQLKRQELVNNSPQVRQLQVRQDQATDSFRIKGTLQRVENKTGLPNQLKAGVENLSGISMDDVKVHYNSAKPAQLQAHAYAQGTNIHLGSGQEKHLPHEAWHVVQQKQGRVKPTMQMKEKVNINDDTGLEREADVMGAKAMQLQINNDQSLQLKSNTSVVQFGQTHSTPGGGGSSSSGGGGRKPSGYFAPPTGGHASRTTVYVPKGQDPSKVKTDVTNAIGTSPAPFVQETPSEVPKSTTTMGQPIRVSTVHQEDQGVVQVEAEKGHVLGVRGGQAAGITYKVHHEGTAETGGKVHIDREPYGETDHESLRTFVGKTVIDHHVKQQIKGAAPDGSHIGE